MSTGRSSGICLTSVDRFGREGVQLLRAGVLTRTPGRSTITLRLASASEHRGEPDQPSESSGPGSPRRPPSAAGPAAPCSGRASPAASETKVEQPRERDHARAEVVELGRDRPALDAAGARAGPNGRRRARPEKYGDRAEERAQDERHRHVRRQQRGHHARPRSASRPSASSPGRWRTSPPGRARPETAGPIRAESENSQGHRVDARPPPGTCPARRRGRARASVRSSSSVPCRRSSAQMLMVIAGMKKQQQVRACTR